MQEDEEEEEDVLFLLDESEALELVEFDPTVDSKTHGSYHNVSSPSWRKYFNKSLSDEERATIMKDSPKSKCDALVAPQLDQQVKEQMQQRGKHPHFGSKKSLYNLRGKNPRCCWAFDMPMGRSSQ